MNDAVQNDIITDIEAVVVKFTDGTVAKIDSSDEYKIGLTLAPTTNDPDEVLRVLVEDIEGMVRGYLMWSAIADRRVDELMQTLKDLQYEVEQRG